MADATDLVQAFCTADEETLKGLCDRADKLEDEAKVVRSLARAVDLMLHGKDAQKPAPKAAAVSRVVGEERGIPLGKFLESTSLSTEPSPAPVKVSTPATRAQDDAITKRRREVARYLATHGPKSTTKVGEDCGIATKGWGCVSQVLRHEWFQVTAAGMACLTGKGEQDNKPQ